MKYKKKYLFHVNPKKEKDIKMNDDQLKTQMVNALLQQQNNEQVNGENAVKKVNLPDKETIEKFKEIVNIYVQADDLKKKLQDAIKEQNNKVKQLSKHILSFMAKYDIEDLKAGDGVRLRYKKNVVKSPLSAKIIKERIEEKFEDLKNKSMEEIQQEIFGRDDVEKVSLRRLKKKTLEI